jgi:hypothetical protein
MDIDQTPGPINDEAPPPSDNAPIQDGSDSGAAPLDQGNDQAQPVVDNRVPESNPAPAGPTEQKPVDWQAEATRIKSELEQRQKAYQNLRPAFTKTTQELAELKRRYDGIDPDAVRAWRQAQAEAQQAKLPAWHPKHPEASRTMAALERVEAYRKAVNALPQDQRQAQAQAMAQALGVSEQDVKLAQEYQGHRETTLKEFSRDPESWLQQRMQPMLQDAIQQHLEAERTRMQAETQVDQWFTKNDAVAKEYGEDMRGVIEMVQTGKLTPFQVAAELASRQAEIDRLRAQVDPARAEANQALAQQQLLRNRATTQRQPVPSGNKPADTIRKEALRILARRGINPTSASFADFSSAMQEAGSAES